MGQRELKQEEMNNTKLRKDLLPLVGSSAKERQNEDVGSEVSKKTVWFIGYFRWAERGGGYTLKCSCFHVL